MSEYFLERSPEALDDAGQSKFKNHRRRTYIKLFFAVAALLFVAALVYLVYIVQGMPDLTDLEDVNPAQVTRLFSSDGQIIHELFKENRVWISYDKIPEHIINAAIATEDREFFDHWGINLKRVPRAALVNLLTMSLSQGSSTITMQVARNLYLEKIGFERTFSRKVREALTAIQIERTYSKKEILQMYLNVSFFGRGASGINSAAKRYFQKEVPELTVAEGAFLVGVLKGPAYYEPRRHPERARLRRDQIMKNMVVFGKLQQAVYDSLRQLPIDALDWDKSAGAAPYFAEAVRQQLNALQDSLGVDVYRDGLNVFTTLNTGYQAAVDSAVARQMPDLQSKVRSFLKKDLKRLKKNIPDSLFDEKTEVQIAFIALDHRTGEIKALVGGRDFERTKFNRAMQARRQPGSTFKPFLYTAAIDNGYTPIDKLLNQPVVIENGDGTRWTPENFNRTFGGLTSLREGLRLSLNIISARLILDIGPQVVVNYAHRMGISTELSPYPSLAMGSTGVIPLEMVSAFGVLANGGVKVDPIFINRIEDRYGNVIYEKFPRRQEVISRATAYIMTDMLENALKHGTGASAASVYKFYAPAAGKTGTTNDYADAWFIGYTPHLTAGLWVGLDSPELKMGPQGVGSKAALPFWAEFMRQLYEDLPLPQDEFKQPPDVVRLDVCKESGKRANSSCPEVYSEVFNVKFRPGEYCDIHNDGGGKRRNIFGF